MRKDFLKYEDALALKELGFDEPCFGGYLRDTKELWIGYVESQGGEQFNRDYHITAPIYQQSFRFFREKYNMLPTIYSNASGWCFEYHDNEGGTHRYDSGYTGDCEMSGAFTSYEKAELACLKKLIEICTNSNTKV